MAKDKKANTHTYVTRSKSTKKQEEYNEHESSSDDEEWEDEETEDTDEEEFDPEAYQRLLLDLFPSKFMKKKAGKAESPKSETKKTRTAPEPPNKSNKSNKSSSKGDADKSGKASKKGGAKKETAKSGEKKSNHKSKKESIAEESSEEESSSDEEELEVTSKQSSKKKKSGGSKSKSKNKNLSESESENEDTSDSDDDEYDEEELEELLSGNSKLNIIFTLGGAPSLEESESEEEDESEEDSDDESESGEENESDNEGHAEETPRNEIIGRNTGASKSKPENTDNGGEVPCDNEVFDKFNKMIASLPEADKENGVMKSIMKEVSTLEKKHKKEEEKKTKKLRGKNTVKFRKLLRDKNVMNDTKFFETKMSVEQQELVLKQIEEVRKHSDVDKPYRLAVLDADIPIHFKSIAYKKINALKYMEPGDGEYYKIKNWVDTFMQIPFGKYKTLPLSLSDGVDASHEFMTNAKSVLDKAVFGLDDAKLQVMQMIGQWIANPDAIGTAIAIKGPMGTGKTTLVKEGISKILGRDFAFIALGGATDSSFLEGHSYTYEGSTWGKIVDILVKCKCMNPIIYFDELDKVSDTPKGEEITGILTHLTDTTQNSKFHDKYFSELDFDLSRCLFIFSYNDESKVNPILRDRMYRIQTKGYDAKEKSIIANDYIVPSIREQVKFDEKAVTIPNDVINHIVDKYTDKEDGVRNLKRCLEIIHTKLNLYRLMKPGTNLFEKDMKIEVTFPVTVTKEIVDKLIKQDQDTGSWKHMYM